MEENTNIPDVVYSDEIKEAYLKVYGNGSYETAMSKIDNVNLLTNIATMDPIVAAIAAGLITKAQAEILKEYKIELDILYSNTSSGSLPTGPTIISDQPQP